MIDEQLDLLGWYEAGHVVLNTCDSSECLAKPIDAGDPLYAGFICMCIDAENCSACFNHPRFILFIEKNKFAELDFMNPILNHRDIDWTETRGTVRTKLDQSFGVEELVCFLHTTISSDMRCLQFLRYLFLVYRDDIRENDTAIDHHLVHNVPWSQGASAHV